MNSEKIRILVVAGENKLKRRVKKIVGNRKFVIQKISEAGNIYDVFEDDTFDIIILTSQYCKERQLDVVTLLKHITASSPVSQVLFLVEKSDIDHAMSAVEAGGFQYAKLPVSDQELKMLIEAALIRRPQVVTESEEASGSGAGRFGNLVGKSEPMQQVYRQIMQAAVTDIPILLLGETGTGKDLASRLIHRQSRRQEGPYIPVNLGALPSELVASELFGHEKGAFTGSVGQHKGVFEQGNGGTVFLDEVDAVNEKVQVSLLRLLEQRKFNRLGGRRSIKSDARLIAASNANLEELVHNGNFREDLYYRLDVFRITMPPLRKRPGDIPLIVQDLLARYNKTFNKKISGMNAETMDLLEAFDWPGNVRELKNVIQRAVLICEGSEIRPEHLPVRFRKIEPVRRTVSFDIGTPLDDVEKEMVIRALQAAENNRKKAAELLGISRRAIYNKLRKHNID